MRRANGPLRQKRQSCHPSQLILAPAAILILLALYTVTRSSVFNAEHGPSSGLQSVRARTSEDSEGSLLGFEGRAKATTVSRLGEQAYSQRSTSKKLETLDKEYSQLTLQTTPTRQAGQLTADQVRPLDMVTARQQLRPQTQPGMQVQRKGKAEFPFIIYVLLESEDKENDANFQYYVREAVREDEGCTHVILIDQRRDVKELPRLPVENAKYIKRKSDRCWLGAVGDYLRSSQVDLSTFTSFLVLTSRLRGPFLPAYVKDLGLPWPSLFTGKLSNQTKLVGPVITCQDIVWPGSVPESQRTHGQPYFPPHMLVSDQAGMQLLLKDERVFTCHDSQDVPNPERYSVLSAAQVILNQGFNLDSLLQRYQGVRWSVRENWNCNAGLEIAGGEHYYDGISVHPMEVMFVEVTGMMLRKGVSTAKAAKKYDKWKAAQAALSLDLSFNMYAFDPRLFRAAGIAYMDRRGPGCFDFGYYQQNNPELVHHSIEEQWAHFVEAGQFEDRLYRFNCVDLQARSFNCFDSSYYNRANEDLNQLRLEGRPLPPQEAWAHFLRNGFFEQRNYRFMDICGEDLDSPNNLGEGT